MRLGGETSLKAQFGIKKSICIIKKKFSNIAIDFKFDIDGMATIFTWALF